MRSRRVAYLTIALALPLWGLSTAARADEPADLAVLEDVTVATTAKGVTVRLDFSSPRSPQVSTTCCSLGSAVSERNTKSASRSRLA